MIDKKRIVRMTHMAIYDKRHGEADRKMNEYFKHDYIARKNFTTRLCALAGGVIVIIGYWLHKIVIDGTDIFALDYIKAAVDMGIFLLALTVVFTVIGTIKAAGEYDEGQERMKNYIALMNQLERLKTREEREKRQEASDIYYGADIADKRDDY